MSYILTLSWPGATVTNLHYMRCPHRRSINQALMDPTCDLFSNRFGGCLHFDSIDVQAISDYLDQVFRHLHIHQRNQYQLPRHRIKRILNVMSGSRAELLLPHCH